MQTRVTLSVLVLSVVAAAGFAVLSVRNHTRVYTLTLATAAKDGEYYAFGQALSRVVAQHHPRLRIQVLETQGSQNNVELLLQKKADLAIVQSDASVEPPARAIASLFPEVFHLVARQDPSLQNLSDLQGKRVALPPEGSGSYALFWPLAQHYGLSANNFLPTTVPPVRASAMVRAGQADALFRVIGLGNPAMADLLRTGQARLLPIDQVSALQLSLPQIEAVTIPKGIYGGAPPIPPTDLPGVGVRAMLIAHETVDASAIYEVTRILYEARNELVTQYPQAATIQLPEAGEGLGVPLHPGAKAYYRQDEPNFVVQYAEPLGLLLSMSVLAVSSLWQFRLWLLGRQKNRADMYNLEILALIDQVHDVQDVGQLRAVQAQLFEILRKVVVDLDEDRISPESFQSFTFPWEVAITTIRHREMVLLNRLPLDGVRDRGDRPHRL